MQQYNILGRQVGAHYLAMLTLGTLFGTTYAMAGGSKKPQPGATPPINASSSDEADFIKKFLDSADSKEKSEGKH